MLVTSQLRIQTTKFFQFFWRAHVHFESFLHHCFSHLQNLKQCGNLQVWDPTGLLLVKQSFTESKLSAPPVSLYCYFVRSCLFEALPHCALQAWWRDAPSQAFSLDESHHLLVKRLWKFRCCKCKISSILSATSIAFEQEVILDAITIALVFARF